jgi:hypothetical protein
MKLAKVPIRAAKKLVAGDRAKSRDRAVEADHEPAGCV